jgi:hypothetical protein
MSESWNASFFGGGEGGVFGFSLCLFSDGFVVVSLLGGADEASVGFEEGEVLVCDALHLTSLSSAVDDMDVWSTCFPWLE